MEQWILLSYFDESQQVWHYATIIQYLGTQEAWADFEASQPALRLRDKEVRRVESQGRKTWPALAEMQRILPWQQLYGRLIQDAAS